MILRLRQSDEEGIWIDQLCIRQDDEKEKQEAISSMDLIYQSARLVLIVLEDICLSEADVKVVGDFYDFQAEDNKAQAINAATEFLTVFRKIIKARWFSRAWCMHEHLTSRIARLLISKPRWYKCRPDLAAELPGPARLDHVRDTWSPYRSGPSRNARDEQAVDEDQYW